MKNLVVSGVKADISELERSDDPLDRQLAKQRQRDLRAWQVLDHPFSYTHYLDLCRIVNPTGTSLPPSSAGQLVQKTFMTSLIDLGLSNKKSGAPYIKGGSFQAVLPCAVRRLSSYATRIGVQTKSYSVDVLMRCWRHHQVNFIPWSPPSVARRGPPLTTVVYNAWATFGAASVDIRSQSLRPQERRNAQMVANRDKAREDAADARDSRGLCKRGRFCGAVIGAEPAEDAHEHHREAENV